MMLAGLSAVIILVTVTAASPKAVETRYLKKSGSGDDLPFSHVVDAGDTVYLAGGIGIDPKTGMAPPDIKTEIRLLLEDMKGKLDMVGLTMDNLVSVQVFCTDLALYDEFNAIYRTYFRKHLPARAFVGSGPLLRGGHFEIMGIARRP
jgi:enamine deaminase RidA (YjgF/YER057c/UK114 family)